MDGEERLVGEERLLLPLDGEERPASLPIAGTGTGKPRESIDGTGKPDPASLPILELRLLLRLLPASESMSAASSWYLG